jgi:hypothetical protein
MSGVFAPQPTSPCGGEHGGSPLAKVPQASGLTIDACGRSLAALLAGEAEHDYPRRISQLRNCPASAEQF